MEQLDQSLRELLWLTTQHEGLKRIIGLDIEKHYKPTSSTSSSSRPGGTEKVATLMLCCGNSCLIIQLLHMDSLYATCYISEFLQLQELTFVGVRIQHCLEALERDYGIKCRNALDLGQLPRILGSNDKCLEGYTLIDLASKVAKMHNFLDLKVARRICNGADLCDWGVTTLSLRQIEAATLRAYLCFYASNYLYDGYCKRFEFWDHDYDHYYTMSRFQKFVECLVYWFWLMVWFVSMICRNFY
uniref:3'-5' exonuclease domain-containing protein n=1 Tax=Chenopodium quinoa TaxID=63459 RepID=A0A803M7G3_CHEQI